MIGTYENLYQSLWLGWNRDRLIGPAKRISLSKLQMSL